MTSSYKGIPLQKAGERFGLKLSDLEELFDMRETAEGDQFGLPLSRVQVTEKGRGGVLGYKSSRTPTAVKTYGDLGGGSTVATGGSFGNITVGGGTPTPTPTPTKPEPKQYFGTVGGVGVEDIGQKGFGLKDYYAALGAGYEPESIKRYVDENRNKLFNIGEGAQKALGIEDYVSTTPGVFDYAKYGQEGFGMQDVQALRAKSVAEETIQQLASQAPRVGPEAARQLNYTPSASQQQNMNQAAGADVSNYDYSSAGLAGFGMEDVKALTGKVSYEQMQEIAKKAPGGQIGPAARQFLGL
jgi:hypothetical protein